jgi:hypothetical protein
MTHHSRLAKPWLVNPGSWATAAATNASIHALPGRGKPPFMFMLARPKPKLASPWGLNPGSWGSEASNKTAAHSEPGRRCSFPRAQTMFAKPCGVNPDGWAGPGFSFTPPGELLLLLLLLLLWRLPGCCCCCCIIDACVAAINVLYQCLLGLTSLHGSAVATACINIDSCWGFSGLPAKPCSGPVDTCSRSPHKPWACTAHVRTQEMGSVDIR